MLTAWRNRNTKRSSFVSRLDFATRKPRSDWFRDAMAIQIRRRHEMVFLCQMPQNKRKCWKGSISLIWYMSCRVIKRLRGQSKSRLQNIDGTLIPTVDVTKRKPRQNDVWRNCENRKYTAINVSWRRVFNMWRHAKIYCVTMKRSIVHRPWSIVHRPSSIVHRPSSIVHRPSSIVHRPSSIVHRPSSIVHRPSSIVHRPSSIVHRPSSIVHRPSSIVHRPSSIVQSRF